ncbi:unnamed protein product [Fusarium venenatum]|uniref:Fe2OG dioxygenase domain-containing protein n=1 Tax=Fusarium venenatum TaxID=56646 RepID=A0A2L2TZD9_9HYPO|nr:uncharacterized protein FVRRES_04272 [Fusarium venenatum]CEI67760.1 unnamed protein product [Fusarium venenatum]
MHTYQITSLAEVVLEILGLGLGLSGDYFNPLVADVHAVFNLLHYPPSSGANENERGIGAHRDFGCVTLLLKDEVGGLQVQNMAIGEWIDVLKPSDNCIIQYPISNTRKVEPAPGAYLVNLWNLMIRWSNNRYTSNIHRVINAPGRDHFSIPFFLVGNMNYVFGCLPWCRDKDDAGDGFKGAPISVRDFIAEQHRISYEASTKDFIENQHRIGLGKTKN